MPKKGYKQSPEHVAARVKAKLSDETRAKMSESHMGKSWGQHSEETKQRISESRKGKRLTPEQRATRKTPVRTRTMDPNCKHPDGCALPSRNQGWCQMHYARVKTYGDPGPAYSRRTIQEDVPEGSRRCTKCREIKSLDEFYQFKTNNLGRHTSCKTCQRHAAQIKKYGISSEGGFCAICGRTEKLVIDHDHDTGATRGVLCGDHNIAIGLFRDDPAILRAAALYLEERQE